MPEERSGRPYLRASWPIIRFMNAISGVPAIGAPGLHRHRGEEVAVDHRAARPAELGERDPGERLGVELRDRAHRRGGRVGAGQHEGRDHHRLARARVDLERAQHGLVPDQRRIAVDQRDHHRVPVDEVLAEQDARHPQRVRGALGRGHRAHEGLVGVLDRAVGDVQMALGNRDVDRLADHRPGVVHRGRHVGELVELVEVLKRAVAPLVVEVIDEGRAVSRCKRDLVAADLGIAQRIARVHREAARVPRDQPHQQLARDPHPVALDLGAGVRHMPTASASRNSIPTCSRIASEASWTISRPSWSSTS